MSKLAVISEETVRKLATRRLALGAVRTAFEATASERSGVFGVVFGTGLQDGEAFAIKSGMDIANETVGFKRGTYWAGNGEKDPPAHGSTTRFPGELASASYLNGYRTAAANALAVSVHARDDAAVLGVIGAGSTDGH